MSVHRSIMPIIGLAFCFFLLPDHTHAGAWTLPRGHLWVKSSVFYQSTSEQFCTGNLAFCNRHDRGPFNPFIGGRSRSLVVFNEAAYGVTGWLDLGVQIPYYSLEFRDLSNPERPKTQKVGDIRFYAKYRIAAHPFVASIRVGAKSPTGGINVNSEVVPVGEGQWDIEVFGDLGRSLSLFPGYVNLNVGYRQRTENKDFDFKPGDEFVLLAEGGWSISPNLMAKGSVDYLISAHPRSLGITFTSNRRELLVLAPTLLFTPVRTLTIEGMIRFPVRGEGIPAGPQFSAGVSYVFDILNGG